MEGRIETTGVLARTLARQDGLNGYKISFGVDYQDKRLPRLAYKR